MTRELTTPSSADLFTHECGVVPAGLRITPHSPAINPALNEELA